MIARARRFVGRHLGGSIVSILLFIAAGLLLPLLRPAPAQADEEVDGLKNVALSDVALNQRLAALEALKVLGSSGAMDALEEVASRGPLPVAAAACAQLGRANTSASKGKLKALLEDTGLAVEVRIAAASCIAEHWKDSGDLSYLESKCASNEDLRAHAAVLKSRVYRQ
jgi:hypothetical protein